MQERLDIEPLTPARFADLAALFEEGGDPKWCWYCCQVDHIAYLVEAQQLAYGTKEAWNR